MTPSTPTPPTPSAPTATALAAPRRTGLFVMLAVAALGVATGITLYLMRAEADPIADRAGVGAGAGPAQAPGSGTGLDGRPAPDVVVLGVVAGPDAVAFPLDRLSAAAPDGLAAVNHAVGGSPIVVFFENGATPTAWSRSIQGRTLSFRVDGSGYVDHETETSWTRDGQASAGPLSGAELIPATRDVVTWSEWVRSYPDSLVWAGDVLPEIRGDSTNQRVQFAIRAVRARYPYFRVDRSSVGRTSVLFQIGWDLPEIAGDDPRYATQVEARVQSFREATLTLLQSVARTNRSLKRLGAFEDRLIVPIWSRKQILGAGPPVRFHEFATFSKFQADAVEQNGYNRLGPGD